MKLLLNGELIPRENYSYNSAIIDVTDTDDQGHQTKGVSDEFEFRNEAFDLIKATFIDSPEYAINSIEVKLYDNTCCDTDILLFAGSIRANGVNYCHGDCECTVKFIEETAETKVHDCFRSTLIADNWNNFVAQQHPRIMYCIEHRPEALGYLLIALCAIINLVLGVFQIIVAIVSWIIERINNLIQFLNNMIDILNVVPGVNIGHIGLIDPDGDSSTTLLEQYQNWLNQFNDRLIGCARKHPSPLVRAYIKNVCDKCGVAFQSTILNTPASEYFNMVLLSAPMAKGTLSDSVTWIGANEPYLTLNVLLDRLNTTFNAEWRVLDVAGTLTLVFEREDYFDQGPPFVDFNELKAADVVIGKLCLNFTEDEQPAYLRLAYNIDALDICGNEAKNLYSDIIEWNVPYNSTQVGEATTQIPFGMARFRDDGVNEDILATGEGIGGIGDNIASHNGTLILNAHTAAEMKLLIWNGNVLQGKVSRFYRFGFGDAFGLQDSGYTDSRDDVYNFPLLPVEWQCAPGVGYPANVANGSLYKRFHAYRNPRLNATKSRQWSFTFKYNCSLISNLASAKWCGLPIGVGKITKLSINEESKTITLSGTI